jgi:NADPH2:quinone reductase
MRAWQVQEHGEPRDVLRLVDREVPEPGPGQVRIKVTAAGLGLPDVFMCRGHYPLTPPRPFTPGQEVAGVVTAVGPDVKVPVGQRVMTVTSFTTGDGGFAEETLAFAGGLSEVPDGMKDTDAATFVIAFHTAWAGLVAGGRIASGEQLVVLGAAGGTGSAAVQLAHALGARVIAVAGGADKVKFCLEAGADVGIDHRSEDVRGAIMAATDGKGADLVFDPVGGDVGNAALSAIARKGRFLLIGYASGSWVELSPLDMCMKTYSVVGVLPTMAADMGGAMQRDLAQMAASGSIRPPTTTAVPFEDLPAALQAVADRAAVGRTALLPPA